MSRWTQKAADVDFSQHKNDGGYAKASKVINIKCVLWRFYQVKVENRF